MKTISKKDYLKIMPKLKEINSNDDVDPICKALCGYQSTIMWLLIKYVELMEEVKPERMKHPYKSFKKDVLGVFKIYERRTKNEDR